jgi:hypothetical protein
MFARKEKVAAQINPPTDWLGNLSSLLKIIKPREYHTVDALLVGMAADFAGGAMLRWLLYWLPKSKRLDGAVYKSAVDWKRETGLTGHQVERLKKTVLPRCGFTVWVEKAEGAPTCHYRLDAWKFLRRLSEVLRVPMLYLGSKLQLQNGNPFSGKREMDFTESAKSLTNDSTNDSPEQLVNDSVLPSKKIVDFKSGLPESTPGQLQVIELLKRAGVQGQRAVAYCTLPEAVVRACISSANEPGVRNRAGYLVGALKKQLQAHNAQGQSVQAQQTSNTLSESEDTAAPPPNPLPVAEREELPMLQERERLGDMLRRLEAEAKVATPEPEPISEKLLVAVNPGGNMTAHAAWSAVYHQLELQLDRASFDTWLRSAKLVDYEPDTSTFSVRVHNSYARDMLQHRLYRNVTRILRDVTGRDVTVRFEAAEEKATAQGLYRFLKLQGSEN